MDEREKDAMPRYVEGHGLLVGAGAAAVHPRDENAGPNEFIGLSVAAHREHLWILKLSARRHRDSA
jgi:hypothetical protein